MNAPAHALINLWILRKKPVSWSVVAGSIAPDLPVLIFFIYSKIVGSPEHLMWRELFPLSDWYAISSGLHSFVLLVPLTLAALIFKQKGFAMFVLSMLLHAVTDFPFRAEDAYMHFYPVSNFRFESPISYWDPARFGSWYLGFELILCTAAFVAVMKKYPDKKAAAILSAAVYGFMMLYLTFS